MLITRGVGWRNSTPHSAGRAGLRGSCRPAPVNDLWQTVRPKTSSTEVGTPWHAQWAGGHDAAEFVDGRWSDQAHQAPMTACTKPSTTWATSMATCCLLPC